MPLSLTKRLVKGTPLTAAEFDANMTAVETALGGTQPLPVGAATAAGHAVNLGQAASLYGRSLRDYYGAKGDGSALDAAAFAAAIADTSASGRTLVVPPDGTYILDGLAATLQANPVRIWCPGKATLKFSARAQAPHTLFWLNNSLVLDGDIWIENANNAIGFGDGSSASRSDIHMSQVTGWTTDNIELRLLGMRFRGCERAAFGWLAANTGQPPRVSYLELRGVMIDGKAADGTRQGLCGIMLEVPIDEFLVDGFRAKSIDGTAAGSNGDHPCRPGAGTALGLGQNNPTSATLTTLGGGTVTNCRVRDVTDSRAKGTNADDNINNPEVHAYRLTGFRHVKQSNCHAENIASTGAGVDADCEGYYYKVADLEVSNLSGYNAGQMEATFCFKGEPPELTGASDAYGYETRATNLYAQTSWTDRNTCGITVQSSRFHLNGGKLDGFGGDDKVLDRCGPVYVADLRCDNLLIENIEITNGRSHYGIRHSGYGANSRYRNVLIDGVTCAGTTTNKDSHGILVDGANVSGASIGLASPLFENIRTDNISIMSGQVSNHTSLATTAYSTSHPTFRGGGPKGAVTNGIKIATGSLADHVSVEDSVDLGAATFGIIQNATVTGGISVRGTRPIIGITSAPTGKVVGSYGKAGLTSGVAATVFSVTTTNEASADGGAWALKVRVVGFNNALSNNSSVAAMAAEYLVVRAMGSGNAGVNGAVTEIVQTTSAGNATTGRDVTDIALTLAETSEFVVAVQVAVTTSGSSGAVPACICDAELLWMGFITPPTMG